MLKRGHFRRTAHRVSLTVVMVSACAVTPLSNRIAVGEEPFVIAVGEGPDSSTDLYAAPAGGGAFIRLTFSRPEERLPRISPSGTAVAFVRREGLAGPDRWSMVILDLRTAMERTAPLPAGAGPSLRLGWSPDGSAVVVNTGELLSLPLEPRDAPLAPVPPPERAAADSLTRELLGDPPAAMVSECAQGGVCITAAGGESGALDTGATDAIRWGADSVGYFTPRGFQVRPLTGGPSRRPAWTSPPAGLRQITYHPGRR